MSNFLHRMNMTYTLCIVIFSIFGRVNLYASSSVEKTLMGNQNYVACSIKIDSTVEDGSITDHESLCNRMENTNYKLIDDKDVKTKKNKIKPTHREKRNHLSGLHKEHTGPDHSSSGILMDRFDYPFKKLTIKEPSHEKDISKSIIETNINSIGGEGKMQSKSGKEVGKCILGSNPQLNINPQSSLGNLYWDDVGAKVQEVYRAKDEGISAEKCIQQDIIHTLFHRIPDVVQSVEECNTGGKGEKLFEKYIFQFFKPHIPDSFLWLDDLQPEAFEWLSEKLQEQQVGSTRNYNNGLVWKQMISVDMWERKILETLDRRMNQGNQVIPMAKQEAFRRYEAFTNQFNQKYDLMMWKKRMSKSKSSKTFVSELNLQQPWHLNTHSSKRGTRKVYERYSTTQIPNEVLEVFQLSKLAKWMEIYFLKQKSLEVSQNNSLFGDDFLRIMFMQGISLTSLVKLDLSLELSASTVSWQGLESIKLIEKFWCVLSSLVDSTSNDYQLGSNIDIGVQKENIFHVILLKGVIKSHPPFEVLVKNRIKILLENLSKLKPTRVVNIFPGCQHKHLKEKTIPYHKALAAALSGIDLATWFSVTSNRPPIEKKFKIVPKCISNVIYWSEDLADVEKQKFLEYCDLMDTRILCLNKDT